MRRAVVEQEAVTEAQAFGQSTYIEDDDEEDEEEIEDVLDFMRRG